MIAPESLGALLGKNFNSFLLMLFLKDVLAKMF